MAKTKKANKKKQETAKEQPDTEAQETLNEEIEREMNEAKGEEGPVEVEQKPSAELSEEQKDFRDMYIRLMAEFDNYRKRTQREKADLIRFGNKDLMATLLPVLDDLSRTLEAVEKTDNLTSVKDGIRLVAKNVNNIFSRQGLKPIDAEKGTEFTTEFHEAIGSLDMGEEHQGKIIDEVEKGYLYKDVVVRYAKVIVGD